MLKEGIGPPNDAHLCVNGNPVQVTKIVTFYYVTVTRKNVTRYYTVTFYKNVTRYYTVTEKSNALPLVTRYYTVTHNLA